MRVFIFLGLIVSVLTVALTLQSASAAKCVEIPKNGILDRPGKFCLKADLTIDRDTAIKVENKDVLVDLGGFTLQYSGDTKSKSHGIVINDDDAKGVVIKNGTVAGFTIGVSHREAPGLIIKNVTFKNIGAMAINSNAEDTIIHNNHIEDINGASLDGDNAYSIGINISGTNVTVKNNTIKELYKQKNADKAEGEAVGILVVSSCEDCEITDNTIQNSKVEDGAIGIWNAGKGFVRLRNNSVTGFPSGIISVGQYYLIAENKVSCVAEKSEEKPKKRSIGVYTVLWDGGNRDAFGATGNNDIQNCDYNRLTCVSELCDDKLETYLKK